MIPSNPPTILRPDGSLDGLLTQRYLRELHKHNRDLEAKLALVNMLGKPAPLTGSGPVTTVAELWDMLKAGGEHAINVQSLLGQLADPQFTYVPIVQSLPITGDPLSQWGQLVLLESPAGTYTQYEYDARPGQTAQWIIAPTPPAAPPPPPLTYQLLSSNITPVSVNNVSTSAQTLMQATVAAGLLNTVGKTLRVTCFGNFDELSGPNILFALNLVNGATTNVMVIWAPNTPGATKTGLPWMIRAELVTAATGASGNMEAHGFFSSDPATTAGAVGTPNLDHNVATVGTIDLTLAQTVTVTIAFSTASASNVGRQRMMLVELLN